MSEQERSATSGARRGRGGVAFLIAATFIAGAGGMYAFQSGAMNDLIPPKLKNRPELSAVVVPTSKGGAALAVLEPVPVLTTVPAVPALETQDTTPAASVDGPVLEASVPPITEQGAIQQAAALSPELAAAIEQGRILKEGADAVSWGKQNLGYVGKAEPGDVIPGIEGGEARPDLWIMGDSETEGSDTDLPRYESLIGPAEFTDTGGLVINDRAVTLSGVLVPDAGSSCTSGAGEPYDCATWAVGGLREFIGGKTVSCSLTIIGDDTYGACDVMLSDDGRAVDLASWMVSAGIALANDNPATSLYHAQEADAKERKAGLWEGRFDIAGRNHE